jgi:hypothetical protein
MNTYRLRSGEGVQLECTVEPLPLVGKQIAKLSKALPVSHFGELVSHRVSTKALIATEPFVGLTRSIRERRRTLANLRIAKV